MGSQDRMTLTVEGGTLQQLGQDQGPAGLAYATPQGRLTEEADKFIRAALGDSRALAAYLSLSDDPEALAYWDLANYITVRKLGYNDHGRVHAWVTGAASLVILKLLQQGGITPDLVEQGYGTQEDAQVVVLLGTMLHDIGNLVHRQRHELSSLLLAKPILERILAPIYPDASQRARMLGFALHCVACHDLDPAPLTVEAGVTAVADGTDITKGRGRKAFALGTTDIHSVSALAVDQVIISKGSDRPVQIEVHMNNSAGIFQVEETLATKVIPSPLAPYVALLATTQLSEGGEQRIIERVELRGTQFVRA